MNSHLRLLPRRRTRGSAFVTVLLFTFLLLTLVASILKWSLSERQLNIRASYWLEARNAAEAVAEYGFSQIATQFSSHANPPSFDPGGSSPLVLPPTHSPLQAGDFFYGSHVDPSSLEIVGGVFQTIPASGGLYFVDPNDANNVNDTLAGQYVYRRDIRVLAKATVNPQTAAFVEAYAVWPPVLSATKGPVTDDRFTILPYLCLIIIGRTAREHLNIPNMLRSKVRWRNSSDVASSSHR